MSVVIQRRESDRPYRVLVGDQPVTSWVKTWSYAERTATERGWTGEIQDVDGEDAADPVLRTRWGRPLDEVVSALQKAIRRGEEVEAVAWAVELAASGYHKLVWRRLAVIAAEDIGLADPDCAVRVDALWRLHERVTAKQPRRVTELLSMAVLLCARAPKSHMAGRVLLLAQQRLPDLAVPDHALDQHTARGRALDRGLQHFLDEAAQLEGEVPVGGEDAYPTARELLMTDDEKEEER